MLRLLRERLALGFWIGATISIFSIVTLLFALGLLRFTFPSVNPAPFLTTSVAILATVLAIVVSVFMLGIQLTTEAFAPSVAKAYTGLPGNIPTIFLYGLFSAGVLYNLWGLFPSALGAFAEPNSPYLAYSYFLTSTCFFYLALFLVWTVRGVRPESLIERMASKLTAEFADELRSWQAHRYIVQEAPLKENPLEVVEQLSFRAIERGERRLVYIALVEAYLPSVNLITEENQTSVENFFSISLARLLERSLTSNNPEVAGDIVAVAEEMVSQIRRRGIADLSQVGFFGLSDAIKKMSDSAAASGYPFVSERGVRALYRIFELEIQHILPESDKFFDVASREEEEDQDFIGQQIRWEDSTTGLIRFLDELAESSLKLGHNGLVDTIRFVLSQIARKLYGLQYRDRVKWWPFSSAVRSLIEIEKEGVKLGLNPALIDSLRFLWETPGAFGELAMNGTIKVLASAVDAMVQPLGTSMHLGYLGRTAADVGSQSLIEAASSQLALLGRKASESTTFEKDSVLAETKRQLQGLINWGEKQNPPLRSDVLKENLNIVKSLAD